MDLPQDNFILLSLVNTYLRDGQGDFLWLCEEKDWDADVICCRLAKIGYGYSKEQNTFVPLLGRTL
jgi:hypothetical protein